MRRKGAQCVSRDPRNIMDFGEIEDTRVNNLKIKT